MPIIVDGNNLLYRMPRGDRTRAAVRRAILDATRHETRSITVVFDGPPPSGTPDRESLGRVTVVYSGSRSADDLIAAMLPAGAAAKQWSVVTDDRGLAGRVRAAGATTRRLADWRRRKPPQPKRPRSEFRLSSNEIADWEAFFADRPDDEA